MHIRKGGNRVIGFSAVREAREYEGSSRISTAWGYGVTHGGATAGPGGGLRTWTSVSGQRRTHRHVARDSPPDIRRTECAADGDGAGSGRGQRHVGGAREGAERREGNWVRAKREVDSVRYNRTVAATTAAAETRVKKGREGERTFCAFVVFKAAAAAARTPTRLTPQHFLIVAPIVVAGGIGAR